MTLTTKQIIATITAVLGLVLGTVKMMDVIYARREQVARLEERLHTIEAQNDVYESILRYWLKLPMGPIAPEPPP